ncbi:MAG: ammonia channel protein, partial [Aeromonadaceae bacterium]|nr:ammonia channel protein [Aeromonadaceae bacterium]
MKRLFAILALVGAFGLSSPAWSDTSTTATEAATSVAASTTSAASTAATPETAPAATPAAAPADTVNKGDNAWLIVATAFVILMSIPGIALFYGGLVRTKNMLSILVQSFVV